ncbi:kinase-like protein [Trichodelitschia bisporula]|uniref:non-specific serine/threonine protein kinase n=1 Tax=Trichodelitschia bisporula TaxID=703511 RepID=A0A6G1IC04_9PEZI|nr:kinase-like protein [Trichodelitschia bisporula]
MPNAFNPLHVTTVLLFAIVGAVARQQQPPSNEHRISPQENAALQRPLTPLAPHDVQSVRVDTVYRNGKHTSPVVENNKNNQRAVATIAPADSLAAVRAIPQPARLAAAPSDGLSTVLGARARQLQDWEFDRLVLLATVDGSLYARDRLTGQELWRFDTGRPMVDISYHKQNDSDVEDWKDFTWIVEPNQDGSMYVYVRGPDGALRRMGITVKQLTEELSPYADETSPFVYTAEKRNSLFTLNATSGEALKFFSAGSSSVMDGRSCRKMNALDLEGDECEPTQTINLGRAEYTIGIQDKDTMEHVCTIKYFEWTPNNRDRDLMAQYQSSLDNLYIYARYDGSIVALQHTDDNTKKPLYKKKFSSSPVIRVFDVVRPISGPGVVDAKNTPLVLLPQPMAHVPDEKQMGRVFLNRTESGSWYALSEASYPFVTEGASNAECYESNQGSFWDKPQCDIEDGLVGVHSLTEPKSKRTILTIDGVQHEVEEEDITPELPAPPPQLLLPGPRTPLSSFAAKDVEVRPTPVAPAVPEVQTPVPELKLERKVHFAMPEEEGQDSDKGHITDSPESADTTPDPEGDNQADPAAETPRKKKAHRGTRGGRKKRKPKSEDEAKADEEQIDGEIERISEGIVSTRSIEPEWCAIVDGTVVELDDKADPDLKFTPRRILGYGSGGTVVYEGIFQSREVAIKRMLVQHFDLASQEVALLRQSDDHPNVIRYFCHQKGRDFLFIVVERCQASLWDLYHDGGSRDARPSEQITIVDEINKNVPGALYQLAAGLSHLHSLRIIHRDIKPQNILVAYPKKNHRGGPRFVISDFGLCRTLPENASTLVGTTGNAGTVGWKAPELIGKPTNAAESQGSGTANDSATSTETVAQGVKRAVDIFSLGCVFFYVLTNGAHPFDTEDGEAWNAEREINIKRGLSNFSRLASLGDDAREPMHLIQWMVAPKPEDRPTAQQVMHHPFFWSAQTRLNFLCDVSDHWERELRDPPSADLQTLESYGSEVHGGDFLKRLDKKFVDSLGKQRKYTGDRMLDLLRALRNKKNHYADMPADVKARVGELPAGYLRYWTVRFPALLICCYEAVRACGLEGDPRFRMYLEEA